MTNDWHLPCNNGRRKMWGDDDGGDDDESAGHASCVRPRDSATNDM